MAVMLELALLRVALRCNNSSISALRCNNSHQFPGNRHQESPTIRRLCRPRDLLQQAMNDTHENRRLRVVSQHTSAMHMMEN